MKVRISTTVDESLLAQARACCAPGSDASLLEQALTCLIATHRAAEHDRRIDAAYQAAPFDAADEWGDLPSFLAAASEDRRADPR